MIKEFFANYSLNMSDVTFDLSASKLEIHQRFAEPWRVTLVDTGESTMTGGRLKRVRKYVEDEEAFCLTYGDGVADVDIAALVAFHQSHNLSATVTAVAPPYRFGVLEIDSEQQVSSFKEKPDDQKNLINGGFFVLSPEVIDLIDDDTTAFENAPLHELAASGQLKAFLHKGFWLPMDTLRDKNMLENLWSAGNAPWKVWE